MTSAVPMILKYKTVQESMAAKYGTGAKSNEKKQSFGENVTRIYTQTVSDNPSVSTGPPLQLDWTWKSQKSSSLPDEEPVANETTTYPRPVRRIPSQRRHEILHANGVKENELLRFQKIATLTRKKRIKTVQNMHRADFEERMEEIKDSLQCWKHDDALMILCPSMKESPPVDSSLEAPCQQCSQRALEDVDKTFYKMYRCDGSCAKQAY